MNVNFIQKQPKVKGELEANQDLKTVGAVGFQTQNECKFYLETAKGMEINKNNGNHSQRKSGQYSLLHCRRN